MEANMFPPLAPLPDSSEPPSRPLEVQTNLLRFQTELEFIQCLSNPLYLRELSLQGYLSKPSFLNYLRYLEYWSEPEYIRFITYPTSLAYLKLLSSERFRSQLADLGFVNELIRIGVRHHETWRVDPSSVEKVADAGQSK